MQWIGIIQNVLTNCQLLDVEPYTYYLVDILQRISQHPAQRVIKLTPRVWKTLFADQPIRSDLYRAHDLPSPQGSLRERPGLTAYIETATMHHAAGVKQNMSVVGLPLNPRQDRLNHLPGIGG